MARVGIVISLPNVRKDQAVTDSVEDDTVLLLAI
jgi:hypothetical protein